MKEKKTLDRWSRSIRLYVDGQSSRGPNPQYMVLAVMWYGIRIFVLELPHSRHGIGKGLYARVVYQREPSS